jgi:asparagine synthetase B (glutamine-hydrolysing)
MTIESGGGLDSSRLSTARALSLREQKFALGLEQARFDRTGTAKSPQEVC